jgi:hypothetical protein
MNLGPAKYAACALGTQLKHSVVACSFNYNSYVAYCIYLVFTSNLTLVYSML